MIRLVRRARSRALRPRVIVETGIAAAAIAIGLAWALPAASLGIAAGLFFVWVGGGVVIDLLSWLARVMFRPGASEEELEEPMVPTGVATVWLVLVCASCGYVAHATEQGTVGDVHGYAFLPVMLPWLVLVFSVGFRLDRMPDA